MTSQPDPALLHLPPAPGVVRFSHHAMNCLFEILIAAEEPAYARQAADAAFEECDRLERELSRFVPGSDIAQINACQPGWSVCVGMAAIELLELAQGIHGQTGGAFDVTVGALLDGETGPVGIGLLRINAASREVTRLKPGLKIDLGGIGKGYALDQMAAILRQWEIHFAFLHAGQSSALALGPLPDGSAWPLGLRDPQQQRQTIGQLLLEPGRALSGSGIQIHGQHILDPRTLRPAAGALAAWAIAPTAALSDALSTAFMVMSPDQTAAYCQSHPDISALTLTAATPKPAIHLAGHFNQLHLS